LVLRSAKTVGVVSLRLSKTLMRPFFSATKTRPSLAKRTAVGVLSPLKRLDSWKPLGSVAAGLGLVRTRRNVHAAAAARTARAARPVK
jgi:hypothetical protein